MRNTTFAELPQKVRDAVAGHAGRLVEFTSARDGNHAEIAGVLRTGSEQVFVKGTRLNPDQHWGGAEAWSLRNEAAVVPHVKGYAPELLWQVETGGWLLLGFEHINGRHADYKPGSVDLEHVAGVVEGLGEIECPPTVRMRVEQRYAAQTPDVLELSGSSLLHCDLNPANILITRDGARVVDWAFASRGPAWMECGFLLTWMLNDGWTPAEAEAWMTRIPSWRNADRAPIDLFATVLSRQWGRRDIDGADSWIPQYAVVLRQWAAYRLA